MSGCSGGEGERRKRFRIDSFCLCLDDVVVEGLVSMGPLLRLTFLGCSDSIYGIIGLGGGDDAGVCGTASDRFPDSFFDVSK